MPPLPPVQLQDQGPVPTTEDAKPALHNQALGCAAKVAPLAAPHWPLVSCATVQSVVAPPLLPAQVQSHGPLPDTAEAIPVVHKFVLGLTLIGAALALPQTPAVAIAAIDGDEKETIERNATRKSGLKSFLPNASPIHRTKFDILCGAL